MKLAKHIFLAAFLCIGLFAFLFLVKIILQTNDVHTTFPKYYAFRGCVSLVEKTDTYGTCTLANGQTIKLVLYQGKWYLDGDVPTGWGHFTF
jgi:hypothetical protein